MGIKARLSRRFKILVKKAEEEPKVVSAREHALLIPEVLELILLELPLQDLLVNAQRVNRNFHNLVKTSSRIQEALFFRSIPDNSVGVVKINPLLEQKFRPWFEDIWLRPHGIRLGARFSARLSDYNHFQRLDWNCSYKKIKAYARKEASWRRMLVAQPPVQNLVVKMRKEPLGGPSQFKGNLKFEHGLRMGLFYDLVEDFLENQHAGYFVVRWHVRTVMPDLDGNAAESHPGDTNRFIAVHLCQIIQGRPGIPSVIGPQFKSRGYRPIQINYSPEPRTQGLLFGYAEQDYEGVHE